jgi:hypothetical protein
MQTIANKLLPTAYWNAATTRLAREEIEMINAAILQRLLKLNLTRG